MKTPKKQTSQRTRNKSATTSSRKSKSANKIKEVTEGNNQVVTPHPVLKTCKQSARDACQGCKILVLELSATDSATNFRRGLILCVDSELENVADLLKPAAALSVCFYFPIKPVMRMAKAHFNVHGMRMTVEAQSQSLLDVIDTLLGAYADVNGRSDGFLVSLDYGQIPTETTLNCTISGRATARRHPHDLPQRSETTAG